MGEHHAPTLAGMLAGKPWSELIDRLPVSRLLQFMVSTLFPLVMLTEHPAPSIFGGEGL